MIEQKTPVVEVCEVTYNQLDKANRYRMRLRSDDVRGAIQPGHCVRIAVPGMEARPLPRNFSVCAVDDDAGTFDVLYYVVGYATGCMTRVIVGQELRVEGPFCEKWDVGADVGSVLLVSEDMGGARLMQLADVLFARGAAVDFVAGGPTYGSVASFAIHGAQVGFEVTTVTHDGQGQIQGSIYPVVERLLGQRSYDFVACCASEAVCAAIAGLAETAGTACQVICMEP